MSKIKISCTQKQKEDFCNSGCPEQFDGHLPGLIDCIEKDYNKLCEDCWNEYVDWEITDENNV